MGDLKSPAVIWIKGGLFLFLGLFSAGLLLWNSPSYTNAMLLGICVWACCRAYYFAFYVIEHYVDGEYRYAGLGSFLKYTLARKRLPPEA